MPISTINGFVLNMGDYLGFLALTILFVSFGIDGIKKKMDAREFWGNLS